MEQSNGLPQTLQRKTILALNELGQTVTSSLKLEDVLARVVAEVNSLLNADGVAILLPEREQLVFVAVHGPGLLPLKGARMPYGEGVGGYVMRTGEPVWMSDRASSVSGLATHPMTEMLAGFHAASLLAVPLRHGEQTIGVLEAAHHDIEGLTPDDLPTLFAAANWASIAISNARLHEQAQAAREQQALLEERNRLARELHDAVTQSLYSISTLAGAWRRQIESGQLEPQKAHIAELGDLAQGALREVRLLIYELRPTELEEEGLVGALYRRLETVEQRAGMQTRLFVTDSAGRPFPPPNDPASRVDFYRLPAPVEHGLYRIVQEALNNTLKYSHATLVCVAIHMGRSTLTLEIEDNGQGFDVAEAQASAKGFGLSSMAERAQQLGGRFNIVSSPEKGTTIRVEGIPYRFIDAEEMIG